MIEADIENGDLVLIRQQSTADPGQIVVALIDGEDATLKRYYPEPEHHRIRLHPENASMDDIADQLSIWVAKHSAASAGLVSKLADFLPVSVRRQRKQA